MKNSLIITLVILAFLSCNKDNKRFTITDFSKKRIDTLIPYKWKNNSPVGGYVMYNLKVKGYVNDTVKIKHKGGFDIKLSGKVDTIIQSDYYGTHNIICIFTPYKATKGMLNIEYSL